MKPQKKERKTMKAREKTTDDADRISDLPIFVAHRILSFLGNHAEATRTRVLSTRWNQLAASFPELEFRQIAHVKTHRRDHQTQCCTFTSFVNETLAQFLSLKLRIHRFCLETEMLNDNETELPSSIDTWIASALQNGAAEITLSINLANDGNDKKIYYSLPETTFQDNTFRFLRNLNLSHVAISETTIADVVRNCPEISGIRLFQCRGFETLAIRNLKKLERVDIAGPLELKRVEILTDSLRAFSLKLPWERSNNGDHCVVVLGSCPNLRELCLSNLSVSDQWFRSNLPRFSQLEELEIMDCHELKRVRVSANRVRSFRLLGCDNVERIELDSSNLDRFLLHGSKIPILVTNIVNVQCDHLNVRFDYMSNIDSSWFLKLRQFLSTSNNNNNNNNNNIQRKTTTLELGFHGNKVTFDREELREAKIPQPHEVEEIEVCLGKKATYVDCGALFEGLLWSCHPKRIFIDKYSSSLENTIKVLGEKLCDRESPNCCDSCSVKCWRHELKSVKITIFKNYYHDEILVISLRSLLKRLQSITRDYKVIYNLSWSS